MEYKLVQLAGMDANAKVCHTIFYIILEFETKLSIRYDHKSRTVSFYKNNLFQGIAFRNVPSGLSPSLDIWFESGTVEIMKNPNPQDKIFL